jgi:hypothetical protein
VIKQRRPYAVALTIFALLSALSVVLLSVFILTNKDEPIWSITSNPPDASADNGILVLISLVSSLASLFGFVSTAVLGWREDVRESKAAELEKQRQALEIERLRIELERLGARNAQDT